MERSISQEERLRRAEEIYMRRRMGERKSEVKVASSNVNANKAKISLFKKMAMQLAICSVIYIIFYLIKNTNYVFSADVISKTNELLSYDINFQNVYQQVITFVENNKDKFKLPAIMQENGQEGLNNKLNELVNEENAENIAQNTQTENVVTNEANSGGIGGAILNEVVEEKTDDKSKKSQMELDTEYIKKKASFKSPLNGTITSRYGGREKTDIVSAYHYGIDIGANYGTAIYASMAGTVTTVSSVGDYRKACGDYKWRDNDEICTL